jgi:hypothetical protein
MLCGLGLHEAIPSDVWNDGFYFSHCRHCERALIRRSGRWRIVPKGYQVVWKPRTDQDVDWKAFRGFH